MRHKKMSILLKILRASDYDVDLIILFFGVITLSVFWLIKKDELPMNVLVITGVIIIGVMVNLVLRIGGLIRKT
jgi:predicted membrane-bound mannosyltransferase